MRLAAALRDRRDNPQATGDRERDYRPGAPCMDCGDYPGVRHEDSDCPRAVARSLLPVVREIAAEELLAAAEDVDLCCTRIVHRRAASLVTPTAPTEGARDA